jgi:TonB family protein
MRGAVLVVTLVLLGGCDARTANIPPRPPPEPQWWLPGCAGVRALRVGHDITPPRLVHRVEPVWPETARGLRGIVIVRMVITREGNVCAAQVVRTFAGPVGEDVGAAALTAVRQWRFIPAVRNGHPAAVFFNVSVVVDSPE